MFGIGIHGSYDSYREPDRLAYEKETLESVVGHEIVGGRQHYLNLDRPNTWKAQQEAGLVYDTSLGSTERCGFHNGYQPLHPFDNEFVVFPLTVMDIAVLGDGTSVPAAKRKIGAILDEAAENDAVMTVLWHPRVFNEEEFPGYAELYRWLIGAAQQREAWIGPCEEFYSAYMAENQPKIEQKEM